MTPPGPASAKPDGMWSSPVNVPNPLSLHQGHHEGPHQAFAGAEGQDRRVS
jgi:hypothetical protein